jgi:hypothetical protein
MSARSRLSSSAPAHGRSRMIGRGRRSAIRLHVIEVMNTTDCRLDQIFLTSRPTHFGAWPICCLLTVSSERLIGSGEALERNSLPPSERVFSSRLIADHYLVIATLLPRGSNYSIEAQLQTGDQ